jgi:hypothetical protein
MRTRPPHPAPPPGAGEIRCRACGALLAKAQDDALTFKRGDLQATFEGDFRASVVCYRPSCRTLLVLRWGARPG